MGELTQTDPANARSGTGHLLILACSKAKSEKRVPAPAVSLYDGVNFRVLRKFLRERGWPPELQIKILSARYGLIDATELIESYDKRLRQDQAREINEQTLAGLQRLPEPVSIFINLGRAYGPAVEGIERRFPGSQITYATGRIGERMHQMKEWLARL